MNIPLQKLNHTFLHKPLVVGGQAMEYYGLRKAGVDIDLMAHLEDIQVLITQYPTRVKDLYGDLGVCPCEFEIWKSIHYYKYDFLKEGAVNDENFLIISLDKLLFIKAHSIQRSQKSLADVHLIVEKLIQDKSKESRTIQTENEHVLEICGTVEYIEKGAVK